MLGWNIVNQIARFQDVWVITSSDSRSDIEEALGEQSTPRLRFYFVDVPFWPVWLRRRPGLIQIYTYFWQLRIYPFVRRLHRRLHFDMYHHVTYANDWMTSFVGALLAVPYIRGPGGGAHRVPKSFLREYGFTSRQWERFRSIGQWLFRHDPVFRIGQRRASAILLCNQEALQALPTEWRHKSSLFPVNGISSKDFTILSRGAHESDAGILRVLSAGKLIRLKGFSLAIRAFKLLSEENRQAEMAIVGDGPERSRLEALVRSLGLQGRVRISHWMARDEFLRTLGSCDIFLFPSLRDGGGAVVVEAMAAGKPVVCLDLGGPGFHVTDACGIKVAANTPSQAVHDLADAMDRLCGDPALRSHMGEAARQRAAAVYHWDRLGEHLQDVYHRALEAKSASTDLLGCGAP